MGHRFGFKTKKLVKWASRNNKWVKKPNSITRQGLRKTNGLKKPIFNFPKTLNWFRPTKPKVEIFEKRKWAKKPKLKFLD